MRANFSTLGLDLDVLNGAHYATHEATSRQRGKL